MSDETFEDEAAPDEVLDDDEVLEDGDLDDDDLADDDDDEVLDEVVLEGDLDVDAVVADDTVARVVEAPAKPAKGDDDEDEDVVDLDEELHPDDVEEPLDVLLLERTSSGLLDEDEYDEEEDDGEADDKSDPGSRIPPKRPGEFVCRSCFLVKHPSQLADAERMLCSDCV
jgi:hypothetical protein